MGGAVVGDRVGQDELVPAEAGQQVLGSQPGAESVGNSAEQGVAGGVPPGVVDGLEPVEVEEQHRQGAAVAAGPVQFVVEVAQERDAGEQPGQRVVAGGVGVAVLHGDLGGDVVLDPEDVGELPGVVADRCVSFHQVDPSGR